MMKEINRSMNEVVLIHIPSGLYVGRIMSYKIFQKFLFIKILAISNPSRFFRLTVPKFLDNEISGSEKLLENKLEKEKGKTDQRDK